jgi:hypothetical protein
VIILKVWRIPAWVPWGKGALPLMLGLFVLMRVAEAAGIAPWWARSYLDDILCLPLILAAALSAHRLVNHDPNWRLPLSHGLVALALYGVFFELLLPGLRESAVADPLDLVMYASGLAFFHLLINCPGCGSSDSYRSSGLEIDDESAALPF